MTCLVGPCDGISRQIKALYCSCYILRVLYLAMVYN